MVKKKTIFYMLLAHHLIIILIIIIIIMFNILLSFHARGFVLVALKIIIICVYYDMTVAHQYSTLMNEKLHRHNIAHNSNNQYTILYTILRRSVSIC